MSSKEASALIKIWPVELKEADQSQFIDAVETEIRALHEGNFARYRVSLKEFDHWKAAW